MSKLLSRQIKTSWTEEEFERLRGIGIERGMAPGRVVRELLLEQLGEEATRTTRLLLAAICEVKQTYLDVLETTVTNKALTVDDLEEIERTNRLRRDALAQQFLNQMEPAGEDNDER